MPLKIILVHSFCINYKPTRDCLWPKLPSFERSSHQHLRKVPSLQFSRHIIDRGTPFHLYLHQGNSKACTSTAIKVAFKSSAHQLLHLLLTDKLLPYSNQLNKLTVLFSHNTAYTKFKLYSCNMLNKQIHCNTTLHCYTEENIFLKPNRYIIN